MTARRVGSTRLDPRVEVGLHRLLTDDAAGQVHPATEG